MVAGPVTNRRAQPCPACNPVAVSWGIPWRLRDEDFSTFHLLRNPELADALQRCRDVAVGEKWCAFLISPPGRGKSHLAAAALKASVHPKPGYFWPWGALLRQIRHLCFDDNGPRLSEEHVLSGYQELPALLVLDDVGAEKATEWANQTLYSILNARYEGRLPTIVTTNNPDVIDERILSRYFSGTVVIDGGRDLRRENQD